jgi:hypothetical protein
MALKTETRNLGGLEVHCTQFAVLRQYELLPLVGAAVAQVVDAMAAGKMRPEDPRSVLLLAAALSHAEREDVQKFTRAILAGTTVRAPGGSPICLDGDDAITRAFGGDMFASNQVILFALETNLGSFFERAGSGAGISGEKSEATETASSPSTRTSRKLRRPGDSSVKDD